MIKNIHIKIKLLYPAEIFTWTLFKRRKTRRGNCSDFKGASPTCSRTSFLHIKYIGVLPLRIYFMCRKDVREQAGEAP